MVMENGQPIMSTEGKIIISAATKSYVTGSFSGMTMDGKIISGTFGSSVSTPESARNSGMKRN